MESFYLITPVALILIAIAIKLFLWAVNSGQYEDLDREASRILFDDDANGRKPLDCSDKNTNGGTMSSGDEVADSASNSDFTGKQ